MSGDPASALAAALSEQARLGPSLDRLLRVVEGWAGLAPVGPAPEVPSAARAEQAPASTLRGDMPDGRATGSRSVQPSVPVKGSSVGRETGGAAPLPAMRQAAPSSPVTAGKGSSPRRGDALMSDPGGAPEQAAHVPGPSGPTDQAGVFARLAAPGRAAGPQHMQAEAVLMRARVPAVRDAVSGEGIRRHKVADALAKPSAEARGAEFRPDASAVSQRRYSTPLPDRKPRSTPPLSDWGANGTAIHPAAAHRTADADAAIPGGDGPGQSFAAEDLFADSVLEEAIADALERAAREAGVDLP